jgi:hypothetical protein
VGRWKRPTGRSFDVVVVVVVVVDDDDDEAKVRLRLHVKWQSCWTEIIRSGTVLTHLNIDSGEKPKTTIY